MEPRAIMGAQGALSPRIKEKGLQKGAKKFFFEKQEAPGGVGPSPVNSRCVTKGGPLGK